jgi:hypothetical protein
MIWKNGTSHHMSPVLTNGSVISIVVEDGSVYATGNVWMII